MRRQKAYFLDENVFLEGTFAYGFFRKRFIPDPRIGCGFSYQIIRKKDIGTILFFDYDDIKNHRFFEIVTGERAEKERLAYHSCKDLTAEEIHNAIREAPEYCPITGLRRCDSYIFEEGVVYLPDPAYDAYTLPTYDEQDRTFSRVKIDMDADFRRYDEHLCELWELVGHTNEKEIREFYHIPEDHWEEAIKIAAENQRENKEV